MLEDPPGDIMVHVTYNTVFHPAKFTKCLLFLNVSEYHFTTEVK